MNYSSRMKAKLVKRTIYIYIYIYMFLLLFDVTTFEMARKPMKLQKENPAVCAEEGKHSKGNEEKKKRTALK